jgi:predicted transport protein
MPIFKIVDGKAEKIEQKKFTGIDKEKQLQILVEKNLDEILHMTFVATEFLTSHGGRIDTLAIDRDRRPVIIEYKEDKSSTVLLQGLYYMDWLVEHKAEFEKLVRLKLKKDVEVNWDSGVRLILIAKYFEIWDKFAVNRIKEEVELLEYVFYENNELRLEKTTLPKDFRSKTKTSITSTREYTVEDQLKRIKDEIIIDKVNQLREMIKDISDDIEERATKDHIIFKSTVNFALIYAQKKQFWFDAKMPKTEVAEMSSVLDIRPHKDEVFTHIRCNEKTNLKILASLAKRAYEKTL